MIREFLRNRYERIRSGEFAKEWDEEQKVDHLKTFEKLREEAFECDLSKAEADLKKRLK